jgi:FdhD protein
MRLLPAEAEQRHGWRYHTVRTMPRLSRSPSPVRSRAASAAADAARPSAVEVVDVIRSDDPRAVRDGVAVELPLEVRLNGHPFSVIMRTPGADRDLALGFLFTEGVLRSREDVQRIDEDEGGEFVNVVFVRGRSEAVEAALDTRRPVALNASCGVCGRRSLDSLGLDGAACAVDWSIRPEVIATLPATLREAQPAFSQTGGLHAAGLFETDGRLVACAEDVGRHNAVDKLLGRMLAAGRLPLRDLLLVVSGRSSFEIVQKAWRGGIALVAAVSAPSSLAVALAARAGMTLLGFVRDGRFNVYAHPERVRWDR